jgi:DNA-binding transcriptional LysR family regulator
MLESDLTFRLLDLNLLRVFDAMMIEGSVAGAAARLSITPSAVSHALGRLRVLFKDPLFVRSSEGMQATPRAAEIGGKVHEGLHLLEGAVAPIAFSAATSRRTFRVACSAYVAAVLLPGVIARMHADAPGTQLAVTAWGPAVLDRFEAGQIDVLLGDFRRTPVGCAAEALFEDRLVWALGRDYVLAPGAADRLLELRSVAPEIVDRVERESGFERRSGLEDYCGLAGNPLDAMAQPAALDALPYAMIAPLVVKRSDLVALMPRRLAALFAADLALDLVEPAGLAVGAQIRIAAVRHPEHSRHPAVAWFSEILRGASMALERA